MKHSCTACQMCASVSIGEMSVSLPPFEIFSPKKEMETLFACTGEGGVGEAAGGNGRERERARERGGAFTSGFALWALSLEKKWGGDPLGFIGRGRRTGR